MVTAVSPPFSQPQRGLVRLGYLLHSTYVSANTRPQIFPPPPSVILPHQHLAILFLCIYRTQQKLVFVRFLQTKTWDLPTAQPSSQSSPCVQRWTVQSSHDPLYESGHTWCGPCWRTWGRPGGEESSLPNLVSKWMSVGNQVSFGLCT